MMRGSWPQLLVVEGIDGSGKTTLAKELAVVMHRPYVNIFDGMEDALGIKSRPPARVSPHIGIGEYAEEFTVADFSRRSGASAILDRGIISAEVYRLWRGEPGLPDDLWQYYWREVIPPNTLVLWVLRDIETAFKERDHRFTRFEFGRLWDTYNAVMERVPDKLHRVVPWMNAGDPSVGARTIAERIFTGYETTSPVEETI